MIGHQGFEITYRTSSGELQLSFSCFVKFQKYLTFIFLALHVGLERKKVALSFFCVQTVLEKQSQNLYRWTEKRSQIPTKCQIELES